MAESLKGYIGLSAGIGVEAESGLYVDALPDISIEHIDKLITNEGSVERLWDEIENRSILKLRTFFMMEVNKCHKVADRDKIECLMDENKHLLATTLWYMIGAEVMQQRLYSGRINSATVDRSKAREIRQEFEETWKRELTVAVAGINIHASPCFPPGEPEQNDIIQVYEPII